MPSVKEGAAATAANSEVDVAKKVQDGFEAAARAIGGRVVSGPLGATPGAAGAQEAWAAADEEEEYVPPRPDVEVDEADKRMFIRTLLSGEPFKKQYKLFGDVVQVSFKTRTVADNKRVKSQMLSRVDAERQYLLLSMESLVFIGEDGGVNAIKGAEFISEDVIDTASAFDGFCDVLYYALLTTFRSFETLCDTMFERANDRPFWLGTGGEA